MTMTFTNVLLICMCAIAGCAALVFAVETLVAFCLHEQVKEETTIQPAQPMLVERPARKLPADKAA